MIRHLLLDIEGTTCPVSFVSDVLFPYATSNLVRFIEEHAHHKACKDIWFRAWDEWTQDKDPDSQQLLLAANTPTPTNPSTITAYFKYLMAVDRKSTALKDLQGMIWKNGYDKGELKAELYPETTQCLRRWHDVGLILSTYSSGSIPAQKLLYANTNSGDLRALFSHWFDTHTGPKKEAKSYQLIAQSISESPKSITFVSDNQDECNAAEQAGLQTLFSLRAGNPDQNPGHHRPITSLDQVMGALNS